MREDATGERRSMCGVFEQLRDAPGYALDREGRDISALVDRPLAIIGAVCGADNNNRVVGVGRDGAQFRLDLSREEVVKGLPAALGNWVVIHVIALCRVECFDGRFGGRARRAHPAAHNLGVPNQPVREPPIRGLSGWVNGALLLRDGRQVKDEVEYTDVVKDISAGCVLGRDPVHVGVHVVEVIIDGLDVIFYEDI